MSCALIHPTVRPMIHPRRFVSMMFLALTVLLTVLGTPDTAEAMAPGTAEATAPDSVGPVVTGSVRAPGYRGDGLLPGALVELRQGGQAWTVVADETGTYRLPGGRSGPVGGRVRLSVFHVAAHTLVLELLLPSAGEIHVDLELEHRPILLSGVEVGVRSLSGPALSRSPFPAAEPRLAELEIRSMEASSGMVESGLVRGLGRPPPGEEHREPQRVLFARGSTVDARQFLLDGAPILAPFHLAGLVPAFDARALGEARVYVGGAPARYEGGLSHMLDVKSREARRDRIRGEVALDGVALRGGLELPLPLEGGILATGRRIHGVPGILSPGGDHPYGFGDFLLRGSMNPMEGHQIRATGFLNRESVELREVDEVSWGNRALSLGWSGGWGRISTEATLARSDYRAAIPVEWPESLVARSLASHSRASMLFRAPWGEGEIIAGGSADRQGFGYRLDRVPGSRGEEGAVLSGSSSPTQVPATQIQSAPQELRGDRAGLFLEADRRLAPGVRVQAGGRVDHFGVDGTTRVAPRASIRVLLTEEALLTLSGGRYHQPVAVPGLVTDTGAEAAPGGTTPGGIPPGGTAPGGAMPGGAMPSIFWNPTLAVASASHLVLSLDQALSPELALGVSGFVKHFQGTGGGPAARVNASGTDLRISRDGERLEGWAGYAISWFWEPSGNGQASSFTGRHLLTTGMRVRPTEGLEVGLSLGYGAGLPLTEVTPFAGGPVVEGADGRTVRTVGGGTTFEGLTGSSVGAPMELAPEEDFLRLDLEVSWEARPRIGGRSTELRPYLRVINALDRRDALFHYFDRWMEDGLRPLAERPFLPLVGLEWRF
jgi:hypothetical protein